MRCIVSGLALAALTAPISSASAMPWAEHSDLSRPIVPMASNPSEGPDGSRNATAYFQSLDRAGFRCDAIDAPRRRIDISCIKGRRTLHYQGQFVGAGYLQINRAAVNGRALSEAQMVEHQTRVYHGQPLVGD